MSIIERATRRLEELTRAGVSVPWAAAGGEGPELQAHPPVVDGARAPSEPTPVAATRLQDAGRWVSEEPAPKALHAPDVADGQTVALDLEQLERSGLLVPTQIRTALAEEFRQIKRPLLKNARSADAAEKRLSLIMVTSALPKEGKTFCAINLAMSIATEIDTSVLLVDADVVRPDLLNRLGVAPQKGLLDLLTDPQLRLSDVVLKTNIPKLSILPSGARSNHSTELLASEAMDSLLKTLAMTGKNRVVIFDAPPLLLTTEAKVLASMLGQVVVVVEASSTPRAAVMQAFAALEQCPEVVSVMNKSAEPARRGYGDYYG